MIYVVFECTNSHNLITAKIIVSIHTTNTSVMSCGTGTLTVVLYISSDNTRFDMSMMVNLQWRNDDNTMDEISILKEACNNWGTIASHLNINKEEEYRTINNYDCFQKVLQTWIETGGNNDYPATWMGLKKMLNACELDMCTKKIKDAMKLLDI